MKSNQTRWGALNHHIVESRLVGRPRSLAIRGAHPPIHAPAAVTSADLAEKILDRRPEGRRQRMYSQLIDRQRHFNTLYRSGRCGLSKPGRSSREVASSRFFPLVGDRQDRPYGLGRAIRAAVSSSLTISPPARCRPTHGLEASQSTTAALTAPSHRRSAAARSPWSCGCPLR